MMGSIGATLPWPEPPAGVHAKVVGATNMNEPVTSFLPVVRQAELAGNVSSTCPEQSVVAVQTSVCALEQLGQPLQLQLEQVRLSSKLA